MFKSDTTATQKKTIRDQCMPDKRLKHNKVDIHNKINEMELD